MAQNLPISFILTGFTGFAFGSQYYFLFLSDDVGARSDVRSNKPLMLPNEVRRLSEEGASLSTKTNETERELRESYLRESYLKEWKRLCADQENSPDPICSDQNLNLGIIGYIGDRYQFDGNKINQEEIISEASRRFKNVKFKYNRPTYLDYKKSNTIVLSIASSDLEAAQERVSQGSGSVHTAQAKLADEVKASLDGDPNLVDIQLASSPPKTNGSIKTLSSAANATWTWYVTPKTLEQITLTLSIYNEVDVVGERHLIDGPVYTDKILINASFWDKWSSLLNSFLGAIIAFAGIVGGLITAGVEFLRWRRECKIELVSAAPSPPKKRRKRSG